MNSLRTDMRCILEDKRRSYLWLCENNSKMFLAWLFSIVFIFLLPQEPLEDKYQPPRPIKDVKVEVIPGGVKVKWEKVPGVTHYTIFWGNESRRYMELQNVSTNTAVFTVLGQDKYTFAVTAWNKRGESDYSTEVSVDLKEKIVKTEGGKIVWAH
jgi:hypothetical protein